MSTVPPTPSDGRTWLEQARVELGGAVESETLIQWRVYMTEWAKLVQAQLEALTESLNEEKDD